MTISAHTIERLRIAAAEIGETVVTVSTSAGVMTFDFTDPSRATARVLAYDSQPSRNELSAMLGIPLVPQA